MSELTKEVARFLVYLLLVAGWTYTLLLLGLQR